jgi:hypothetical protein
MLAVFNNRLRESGTNAARQDVASTSQRQTLLLPVSPAWDQWKRAHILTRVGAI